jgi:hypothetical protein
MSSTIVLADGFGNSRQRGRWFRDHDGAYATSVADDTDDIKVVLDLTDYLASSETVSSAAYVDSGAVSSSKSVSTPQVLFTLTGYGDCEVTVTLSTGRTVTYRFRLYDSRGSLTAKDYA